MKTIGIIIDVMWFVIGYAGCVWFSKVVLCTFKVKHAITAMVFCCLGPTPPC